MTSSSPDSAVRRVLSSAEWLDYYTANAAAQLPIPWERGAELPAEELAEIAGSLQAWQLGESSDGSHLLKAAAGYAARLGDPAFLQVAALFIKEEQRHGELLGRFLDLAGVPRIGKDWGDSLFRAIRYSFPSMEVWATPVIMVETIAMLYYRAIHDASCSAVLRAICTQILRDEVPHIRFQYERLAILQRHRPRTLRKLTVVMQRLLFTAVCCAVWSAHARAFRAGGMDLGEFWRQAWECMNSSWKLMDPEQYCWDEYEDRVSAGCPAAAGAAPEAR